MRRLVCACVVRKPAKTGFLASRPISCMVLSECVWCADLFVGQRFCSILRRVVWTSGRGSCWRRLCSLGWGFVHVLLLLGGALWCLFLMIGRLILLMLLTLHPDVWAMFWALKVYILAQWWVGCALRGSSLVGLMPVVPGLRFGVLYLSLLHISLL